MGRRQRLRRAFGDALMDRDTAPPRTTAPQPSRGTVAAWTARFRAAARGMPLTDNEARFLRHRDRHLGQRAFLLGNGPSLNECDLDLLRDEITIATNGIFLLQRQRGFTPTYYVVEDIFVAEDRADQINAFRGPTKFFSYGLDHCLRGGRDTIWTNVIHRYGGYEGFPHFSTDALRRMWAGGTVSYICMQLAWYLGVQQLVLVGFDHSYVKPEHTTTDGDDWTSGGDDPNHFDAGYFGEGYRWHDPMVDRMEQAYRRARGMFEAHDRRIVNATEGGHLEVFPRAAFASLLGG